MVGTKIGVYTITHLLGEGGMGTVYEAVHDQLGKRVAIKILHPEMARNSEGLTRFFNEARAVNLIEHPGIVQIFEFGQLPSGSAYLVMEHLHGETLSKRLKDHPQLPEPEALYLCYQLAAILAAVHERGIVHRDLKPSNIMLVADSAMPSGERLKLLDFGVAKLASTLHASSSQVRTHSGQTLGTPQYMSPEQYRDVSQVDGMTDVYALGIILYQMLAGRTPFVSSGELAVAAMHMYEEPPPLNLYAPQVSERTFELVHRMLRKSKEERPTMAQVLTVLQTMGISITASTQKHSAISLGGSGSISLADVQAADRSGFNSLPEAKVSAARAIVTVDGGTSSGPIHMTPPSTLGTGTGQLTAKSNRLFWWVTAAAGSSVLAGLLIFGDWFTPEKKPSVVPPVRWSVSTTPSGASVIRADTGTLLGKTPWSYQHPPGSGKLQISIQYSGYQTHALTLDNGRDETFDLKLVPMPEIKTEPPPPPPRHRSHTRKLKPEDGSESKDEGP